MMAWRAHLNGWPMKLCRPIVGGMKISRQVPFRQTKNHRTGIVENPTRFPQKRILSTDVNHFAFLSSSRGPHSHGKWINGAALSLSLLIICFLGYRTRHRHTRLLGTKGAQLSSLDAEHTIPYSVEDYPCQSFLAALAPLASAVYISWLGAADDPRTAPTLTELVAMSNCPPKTLILVIFQFLENRPGSNPGRCRHLAATSGPKSML